MTVTHELARFAHELRYEDLPPRVVKLAKRQILGLLGAAFAGARTGGVQVVARAVGRAPSIDGDARSGRASPAPAPPDLASVRATALPLQGRTGVEDAAYLNACASIAHDMDDHVVFGHTGHSAVFAALALGEALERPGREVLTALVLGNELGGRLGAACLFGPQNGQLWSYIHQLSGAAATARLLGLDTRLARHAIGIALAQPAYGLWPGFMGPDSKLTTAAEPLRTGIRAAFLAAAGLTGPAEILAGHLGLLGRIPFVALPGFLTGLGRSWVTETLSVKLRPGCAYVSSAVDATCEALAELRRLRGAPVEPDEVERIRVRASILTVEMDRLAHPYVAAVAAGGLSAPPLTPVVVNFSTPLSLAIALLDEGELTPEALAEERLARDQDAILRFARRVEVEHDVARSAALLKEADRVFDLARLLSEVPLADLAQAMNAQRSLHGGRGRAVASAAGALDLIRSLGPEGRSFARRLVEKRAGDALHGLRQRVVRAFDEAIPSGDMDLPPPAAEPRRGYDLGERPLASFRALYGAQVEVRLRDGATASSSLEIPRGAAGRDDEETDRLVSEKFLRFAGPALGPERARRLEQVILGLEEERDLSAVSGLLSGATAPG